jgi:DNA-binding GntR family transcriptional regulator
MTTPTSGMGSRDIERHLRERIVSHELPPGFKLREEALAEELGVPRSRVRQALFALQAKYLVERLPNRGAIVARMDATQVFQIYDVFELLEGLAARQAATNSQPEDWDDLAALFGDVLQRAVENGDYETYFEAVQRYREGVVRAADNALLADMLSGIYDKTSMIIRRTLILPGRAQQSLDEHRAIIAALQRGDAEGAEHLKRQNMASARRVLEQYQDFVV